MPEASLLYPKGPANVPAEITRIDPAYRSRVMAMIGGLFVFLLLYLVIMGLAGLLAYWLLTIPTFDDRGRGSVYLLILQFGGVFSAGLLCLFLVKGLFKGRRAPRASHVRLHEEDYPQLFDFIRRVHKDTGAPMPRRVYVSPDVNAALIYDTSVLNLIIPPKKDLLIGLGLVNVLTLSEFKGVLAHEFGHFAQRSVGLGSYLYVANRVMHDVIYSRDGLDRFVDIWANIDLRISFPAWGLKGIMWVVRKILEGLYRSLNLLHLSLSRQMEFNADNVAVSVAGSDAIVHGLFRTEFAVECLSDAATSLDTAADHSYFSDDLFYHQTQSASRLRKLRKNELLGLPPQISEETRGSTIVFEPIDDGMPEKYRSHPTDHMRERNAKRIYVYAPADERSPWLLFGDSAGIKLELTRVFYRESLKRVESIRPRPATEVQAFIDAEHAETTFGDRYHGWYDDRFITPGDLDLTNREEWSSEQLACWVNDWPAKDLEQRNQSYRELQSEYNLLEGLKSGEYQLKGRTFTFRNADRTIREVTGLLTDVEAELNTAREESDRLDRRVFLAHLGLALDLDRAAMGASWEAEILERYRFHERLQGMLRGMLAENARLQNILGFLSNNPQMQEEDFHEIQKGLQDIRRSLRATLKDSRDVTTPGLTNVPAGSNLFELIVDRGDTSLERLEGNTISAEWLTKLMGRLEGVLSRTRRLHYKSLGSLLAFQEKLAQSWVEVNPESIRPSDPIRATPVESEA